MRVVWVIAALLVGVAPAFAESPPSLEEALAQAAEAKKPLVLEFHAEWCKPCKYFEDKVLSRADVKAALERFVYVRYDIDEWPGNVIADRLGVAGVPAFLARLGGANGDLLQRHAPDERRLRRALRRRGRVVPNCG